MGRLESFLQFSLVLHLALLKQVLTHNHGSPTWLVCLFVAHKLLSIDMCGHARLLCGDVDLKPGPQLSQQALLPTEQSLHWVQEKSG